ncbi:hypothetical protein OKA04_15975 [Luteolibacter flavescens]|uniref:Uncharacterized protein n=1 Tax=Luteolibacter flavescens TaxID=1859460 RepID=A0ABT3FSM2_9BACT|nr:hypothetical protein [Luteolibacter flavescens]MCW1886236.1 hypothetical protein [Luteolibacter flavescens]
MKTIFACIAVLGIQGGKAGEIVGIVWQTPQEVLAAIDPGKTPDTPTVWHSPRGPVVMHGDLFGDGRHLALVGTEGTSWAIAKDGAWEMAGGLDVPPAWVPPGKTTQDPEYGQYYRCKPPQVPFVLKDLDGDRIPEVLVAFSNDGFSTGYAVARRKDSGIELTSISSQRGEPEWIGGYLVVTTSFWGGRWSGFGNTYYKWKGDTAVKMAEWLELGGADKPERTIAVRHRDDGKGQAFEIVEEGNGSWNVRTCVLKGTDETEDEKDFARIRLTPIPEKPGHELQWNAAPANDALVFELITGIPGEVMKFPYGKDENYDFRTAVASIRLEVEGSEEAKAILKRVSR